MLSAWSEFVRVTCTPKINGTLFSALQVSREELEFFPLQGMMNAFMVMASINSTMNGYFGEVSA